MNDIQTPEELRPAYQILKSKLDNDGMIALYAYLRYHQKQDQKMVVPDRWNGWQFYTNVILIFLLGIAFIIILISM